jgi:polyhydroxybutyrate depolymerase
VPARLTALIAAIVLLGGACGGNGHDLAAPSSTTTSTTTVSYPDSVAARPSAGCGTSTVRRLHRERQTMQVAGEERYYLRSSPPAHDGTTPLPLVVDLHGLAEGAERAADTGRFDDLGDTEGFVSVFPNGSGAPVHWDQHLDPSKPNHDFEFIDSMLDNVEHDLCIDEARVYVTGLSYGAIMSSALACARSTRFAAMAPVSGIEHPDACTPARPVPVLAFHGTADPILFFNGGIGDLGAALRGGTLAPPTTPIDLNGAGYPAAVRAWATANGCTEPKDTRKSAHVIERTYRCPVDAEVAFFIIEGGGHSWPGSTAMAGLANIVGSTTDELDATTEIWHFFQRHALAPA